MPLQPLPLSGRSPHRLTLHPAVAVVASDYPIHAIWARTTTAPNHTIPADRENVLVSRQEMAVGFTVLPPGGVRFMALISAGRTLHDAAKALLKEGFEDSFDELIRLALENTTRIHRADTVSSAEQGEGE